MVGGRLLALWEIASVTLSFLMAEWMILPFAGNSKIAGTIPLALAVIIIVMSHRARGETPRQIGWRIDNFFEAVRLLAIPLVGMSVVVVLVGLRSGGFRSSKIQLLGWVLWLPLWALIQQQVLQGFINRRAQMIWGKGFGSVALVACIFAILHLPNPWLTLITFLGGLVGAWVYQRAPNIPALAISHALTSLLMVWALPPSIMKSLRVGFKYFG